MRTKLLNAFLLTAIFSQQAGYVLYGMGVDKVWYWFNASTHVLMWMAVFYVAFTTFNHKIIHAGRWTKRIGGYGLILSANQAGDELFGTFATTHANEIVLFMVY